MKGTITLSQAIEGYLLHAGARRLTEDTLSGYMRILNRLRDYFPTDPPFDSLTVTDLELFLTSNSNISDKTLLNYHTVLSALYTWATSRRPPLVTEHLMRQIPRPKPEQRVIEPFSKVEVKAMLQSLEQSRAYLRPGKRETRHSLPHVARNRALILLLLDTGIRSSELCNLKVSDLDLKARRVHIFGKGKKERIVRISDRTGEMLWRYLSERPDARANEPLFVTNRGGALTRNRLGKIIGNIGERAGVSGAHPHRFRHTFAVQFLRNGGDTFTLQDLLGHETLEMVRRYLHLAQVDLDEGHRQASPVTNWHL